MAQVYENCPDCGASISWYEHEETRAVCYNCGEPIRFWDEISAAAMHYRSGEIHARLFGDGADDTPDAAAARGAVNDIIAAHERAARVRETIAEVNKLRAKIINDLQFALNEAILTYGEGIGVIERYDPSLLSPVDRRIVGGA